MNIRIVFTIFLVRIIPVHIYECIGTGSTDARRSGALNWRKKNWRSASAHNANWVWHSDAHTTQVSIDRNKIDHYDRYTRMSVPCVFPTKLPTNERKMRFFYTSCRGKRLAMRVRCLRIPGDKIDFICSDFRIFVRDDCAYAVTIKFRRKWSLIAIIVFSQSLDSWFFVFFYSKVSCRGQWSDFERSNHPQSRWLPTCFDWKLSLCFIDCFMRLLKIEIIPKRNCSAHPWCFRIQGGLTTPFGAVPFGSTRR